MNVWIRISGDVRPDHLRTLIDAVQAIDPLGAALRTPPNWPTDAPEWTPETWQIAGGIILEGRAA